MPREEKHTMIGYGVRVRKEYSKQVLSATKMFCVVYSSRRAALAYMKNFLNGQKFPKDYLQVTRIQITELKLRDKNYGS